MNQSCHGTTSAKSIRSVSRADYIGYAIQNGLGEVRAIVLETKMKTNSSHVIAEVVK